MSSRQRTSQAREAAPGINAHPRRTGDALRVLVNAANVAPTSGGTWTVLENLLCAWVQTAPQDRLWVVGHPGFPTALEGALGPPVVVQRAASNRGLRVVQQQLAIRTAAKRFGADVILNAALSGPVVASPSQPQVSLAHDIRHEVRPHEFTRMELAYRRLVYSRTIRRSRSLVVFSQQTASHIADRYPLAGNKIRVGTEGADHTKAWARSDQLGTHAVAFAHWQNKQPEVAVEAWGIVKREDPSFSRSLHVIGARKAACAGLAALAESAGVRDQVVLHGHLDDHQYQRIFTSAAVVLMPSALEGFGLPVVEAMSVGVPVIASAGVGMEEAGGSAAVYATYGSAESFAVQCRRLFHDDLFRRQVVEAGIRHAASFTWPNAVSDIREEAYRAAHGA